MDVGASKGACPSEIDSVEMVVAFVLAFDAGFMVVDPAELPALVALVPSGPGILADRFGTAVGASHLQACPRRGDRVHVVDRWAHSSMGVCSPQSVKARYARLS